MDSTLASIAAIPDHKVKGDKYKALLDQILASKNNNDLQKFIEHSTLILFVKTLVVLLITYAVAEEKTALVVSRPLLQFIAQKLQELPPQVFKSLATFYVTKVQPRAVAFEDQVKLCCTLHSDMMAAIDGKRKACKCVRGRR